MTRHFISIAGVLVVLGLIIIGLIVGVPRNARMAGAAVAPDGQSSEPRESSGASLHADANPEVPATQQRSVVSDKSNVARNDIDRRATILRGRCLDEHREPIAGARVPAAIHWLLAARDGREYLAAAPDDFAVMTDSDGRFTSSIQASRIAGAQREFVMLFPRSAEMGLIRAAVPLPSEIPREKDIGDIVLERAPVVLAGIIIDKQNVPVPRARIAVEKTGAEKFQDNIRFGTTPEVMSDDLGRFEIRTWTNARVLGLSVTHPDYEETRVEDIDVGQQDLKVSLFPSPSGCIEGRILVDDDTMLDKLSVQASCPRGPQLGNLGATRGAFKLSHLRSGECTIEVILLDGGIVISSIRGVRIVENAVSTDPRTDAIDLIGKLEWIQTTIRNTDGKPYTWSVWLGTEGSPPLSAQPDVNGLLRILTVRGGPKLSLKPHRGDPIELVSGGTVVMPAN